jgi:hypothetical protein
MIIVEQFVRPGTPMGPAAPGSKLARLAEGQRLANKLIADGWRPGYLAEELEVNRKALAAWRRGQRAPTQEQLEHMRKIVRSDQEPHAAAA